MQSCLDKTHNLRKKNGYFFKFHVAVFKKIIEKANY